MPQTDILLAGAFAAFTVDLCIYPLDTLKTRIQSQEWRKKAASGSNLQNRALFRGLFQGVGSVIIATLPAAGCFFSAYESLKIIFVDRGLLPASVGHSLASGIAEMASCAVLAPAEVIKQNAQVISKRSVAPGASTSLMSLRMVMKEPGNLFRGYSALVARNLPFTALQFPIFENLKERFTQSLIQKKGMGEKPSLSETAVIAGCSAGTAGGISAFVTTPVDVVKTQMMLLKDNEGGRRPGMMETASRVLKSEGFTGLWRGGALRSIWTAVGSGIYLASYSTAKVYLTKDPDEAL